MAEDVIATVKARVETEQARLIDLDAQIERLRESRNRAEAEVRRLLEFAKTYFELTGIHPLGNLEQTEPHVDTGASKRPKNPSREVVVANALDIIHGLGRPAPRKELFDALANRGVMIHGKDPEMVLSTMLWRESGKIVRLPQYGYWPKDVRYEDANYWPSLDEVIGIAARGPEDGIEADDVD